MGTVSTLKPKSRSAKTPAPKPTKTPKQVAPPKSKEVKGQTAMPIQIETNTLLMDLAYKEAECLKLAKQRGKISSELAVALKDREGIIRMLADRGNHVLQEPLDLIYPE